ncbi:SHOCT domain-containing protein [Enterococcus casseliflavus]|uniref:SHOCT domain-containing protein n=1 Tax=Enterococcus casseliflavus TaxID=37734 RepID=UPI0032E83C01
MKRVIVVKGETNCWFCESQLKLMSSTKLSDGVKVCNDCHSTIAKDLQLNFFNSKKISLGEIKARYAEMGRDIEAEYDDNKAKISDIKSTGIFLKIGLDIASGAGSINTSDRVMIVQLNDNRIAINPKNPEFYYLLATEFSGPSYKEVFSSETSGSSQTKSLEKTTKKGKSGRVAGGAIVGTMLMPGLGTVVGAYAGSKGKDKKKKRGSETVNHNNNTTETTQRVEVKSLAKITLYRIADKKTLTITVNADTKDYNEISSLQVTNKDLLLNDNTEVKKGSEVYTRDEIISKLKELKELVDLGILTTEEFEEKKKVYMEFF